MKKLLDKFILKKFIAVFISITFIFTAVFNNYAFATIGTSLPAIDSIALDNPIIPMSLGKVTSAKYFDSEDIIINIQDLHCHAETQRKIASIIGYIDNTYNLNNVYLEGAFKKVDTSWLSSFNNNKNGTKVLEGLLNSGKLSGTEYYSIINNKKNFVLGIEQEELYKENIKLLGSILSLQPEIDAICTQMEKEINKIKRDYSNSQARKLEKLIKSFKQKDIDAKKYYGQLKSLADNFKLSIDKYPNIKIYMYLLENNHYVNNKKVIHEFAKFVSEMKNILPYQQYMQLLKKSNNFNNIDDISLDLIALDKEYEITKKLKLVNFKSFLMYLEFSQNINPIRLVQEEKHFLNELYIRAGRTKYEKEVSFLSEFINTIRQYFTADISADEYYEFEKNYDLFKTIWPSYFSENILKNLDQYQVLLSKYHKNNILRDKIFAECLISQKNINGKAFTSDTSSAIKQIKSNMGNKKIKLVVTGGFHTRGLERIFEKQRISYVIITPKITQPIEQAKQIYIDNVMYYSNLLKNTINLEPLTQEPLNVSFPKIMNLVFSEIQKNVIFEEYSKQDLVQSVKQFVQEYIIAKQDSFYGDIEILKWDILSTDLLGTVEFYVEYRDNANKATISNVKYRFVDGQVIAYSSIDTQRTKQMLERITTNKYAQPSVELEPTTSTRKKIAKHILEPLRKISGSAVTLMPFEQLHMTIGYDSTSMTQQEMDSLVQKGDTSTDIFSVLDMLGQDFVNFRTSMAGTLKLMPDGVIIYEITDKNLIEKMLGFRTVLKSVDSKYKAPSIVHMSIGRITDMKLLDGTEQSKQELADLLQKLNEKIYEINNKNALSKIKTTFTLKGGYVSSTGDKDFLFRRILPKKESLVVLKGFIDGSKTKLNFIYKVIIAPIIEEFAFRFIPFFISGLLISNPVSIVPAVVTGIVGILGFSFAHPLADKINNYLYNKVEDNENKSGFINKIFNRQLSVRDIKYFLAPSIVLTTVYIAVSLVLPQSVFIALAITTLIHSIYNFFAVKQNKGRELTLKKDYKQKKNSNIEVKQIDQSLIDRTIDVLSTLTYYDKAKEIADALSNLPKDANEKYNIVITQVYKLIDFLKEIHKENYNVQLSLEDKYGKAYEEDTVYGKLRKYCLDNGIVKSFDSNVYLSKVLVHILVPFLTLTDVNSDDLLFYSIIDSLFVNGDKDRDKFVVLSEMGMLMYYAYSLNSNFVQYIVDKLMSKGFISADEEIPFSIKNELKGYNELKQYYFAIFSKEQINENLSKNLIENVKKLTDIVLSITDENLVKNLTDIAFNIDEIAGKINNKNISLLEYQLDLLFKEAMKLKDSDKNNFMKIIGVLLSICEQMVKENKDINARKIDISKLRDFLIEEYDSDFDSFSSIMSQLISIAQPAYNDDRSDSFNKQLCIMLVHVALHIYEPIASKKIEDENSQEYQNRKNQCLDIFRNLALKRLYDRNLYDCLFNIRDEMYNRSRKVGIGFTPETLDIFIEAARQSGRSFNMFLPEEEFISGDVDVLADMIVGSIEYVNPIMMIEEAFPEETSETVKRLGVRKQSENGKAKQISYNIMRQLVSLANDDSADYAKRKRAIIILLNLIAKGIYSDVSEDIPIDFESIKMLANRFDIPVYLYMSDVSIRNINLYDEYSFTYLIKHLPRELSEQAKFASNGFGAWDNRTDNRDLLTYRKPVMTKISGKTDMKKTEVLQVLFRFEVLQKILQYNTSVLSLMDKIKDSKNYEKNMAELIDELQAMINELKKINTEHGNAAQIALDNINESLKDSSIDRKTQVRRNLLLSEWNEETIKDIKEIHTLINAVHQTSIVDFKQEVGDVRTISEENSIQIITANQQSTVSGYNLSNTINSNIVRFLSSLAKRKLPNNKIDDFVCKDELVVWTTRLNAHSVDIFFNFGEADRGISIYYRERPMPGEDIGKKERIRYFKEILEYLGFHVETDIQYSDGNESYGLKASLNKDYGLNDSTDLINIATHVVEIFKYSTNVDYDLKSRHRSMDFQYKRVFEEWLTKAKRRELWYGVDINNYGWRAYGYGPRGQNLERLPDKRELDPAALNMILSYLGCELLPSDTEKSLEEMLLDPNFVDKYFNEPIERAFVEGRLILDEDGILVRNEGYDIVHSMIDEINTNFTETSQQARIVNLVNGYEFDTRILANIGSFVVVSSVMELKTGDKLFVKAIMDPNTRRTKYAMAELITTKTRQKLTSEQLIEILGKEGYIIPKQEWVDSRERKRTKNLLSRDIQTVESPKVQSTPTSDGTGVSVVGNITFNKNTVDENSILVVFTF